MSTLLFDPLTTTTVELQQRLASGKLNSVQIIETYLTQIDAHNPALNAFISLAPRDALRSIAAALDAERAAGSLRGPFHGIPIVLKDSIMTASELGMPTTAGSFALAQAKCKKNAPLVEKLIDTGLIILGKANLTEFCGLKTSAMMPGWSAYGGQTLSPKCAQSPGGSSTGPAVAIAAGFAPLSIGTETTGSIMVPASRNALYAIKPTVGDVDIKGVFSLSELYDSAGPMAKSTHDLVPVTEILLGRKLTSAGQKNWQGLSVGFVDPRVWNLGDSMCRHHEGTAEEMIETYERVVSKLKEAGGDLRYPVVVPDVSELTVDGKEAFMKIAFWDCKNRTIDNFLKEYEESPVRSLADIVKFNEEHKDDALPHPFPDQSDLHKCLDNTDEEEEIEFLKKGLRAKARQLLDSTFDTEGVSIIAAPTDSALLIHGAAAGYPTANVPLGILSYNGRAYGICLIAKAGEEETLLRFMSIFENTLPPRPVPDLGKLDPIPGHKNIGSQ
ncbi:amidase domain-containing protein [Trichoderma breve]|uniref:Amidase domain-containing protein n=1 Tax=Trichoderma breve TaxID=2034170 RepID=A0A9W9E7K5_9HYPO|nr:amidase domain-containing protein [Trichoderma breve]KAJ4860480.1 amidase domain-containing protein [Trichoderma breve]